MLIKFTWIFALVIGIWIQILLYYKHEYGIIYYGFFQKANMITIRLDFEKNLSREQLGQDTIGNIITFYWTVV